MTIYFLLTFLTLIAIIDVYFYYSMRQVIKGPERKKIVPNWVRIIYWGFTVFTAGFMMVAIYYYIAQVPPPPFARTYITGFIFIVFLSKLIGVVFFLLDDFKNGLLRIKNLIFPPKPVSELPGNKISRGTFLKQSGLIASAVPFVTMMYGVVKSAFDYNVINVKIRSPKIPKEFEGFRIVQISDIHTGSFVYQEPLVDAVNIINEQNPDVVFFTGDLVNEVAEEAKSFTDIFGNIEASQGVYSILGNHDYGDYFYPKGDLEGRKHNYTLMQKYHHSMNWDILLNENRVIEKNGKKIEVIGVENWGNQGRFQKYGDIDRAKMTDSDADFKILLSHDPSHWNAKVLKDHKDIDLTLSGHTHGFQMGVEIPGFVKWSPSQYMYEQWAGLYEENGQMIYVNRGLGFIGFPGRVGILPEITVIELSSETA